MVEKTAMDYSIGHIRIKYLDLANMSFAQGHYTQCKGYIDDFLDTVKDDGESGKTIKAEFDKIYANQKVLENAIEEQCKTLGYLERKDFEDAAKTELGINTIHDLKEICWRISLKNGLFND